MSAIVLNPATKGLSEQMSFGWPNYPHGAELSHHPGVLEHLAALRRSMQGRSVV
jgi:hypothetical protein